MPVSICCDLRLSGSISTRRFRYRNVGWWRSSPSDWPGVNWQPICAADDLAYLDALIDPNDSRSVHHRDDVSLDAAQLIVIARKRGV